METNAWNSSHEGLFAEGNETQKSAMDTMTWKDNLQDRKYAQMENFHSSYSWEKLLTLRTIFRGCRSTPISAAASTSTFFFFAWAHGSVTTIAEALIVSPLRVMNYGVFVDEIRTALVEKTALCDVILMIPTGCKLSPRV